MKALIFREVNRNRKSFVVFCLVAIGFAWLYIALFPSIQKDAEQYSRLLDSFPKGVMDAFGFDGSAFDTVEKFLSTEMMSLLWPIMFILLVVSRAGTSFAGSVENRTLGMELALPMSRARLYYSKLTGNLVAAISFCIITLMSFFPICWAYSIDIHLKNVSATIFLCIIFAAGLCSFVVAMSACIDEKGHLYFLVGGVLIASYVFNIVASLSDSLSWLKYSSLFYYFSASEALSRAQLHQSSFIFFGIVAAVSIGVGIVRFTRRDIPV